MSTAKERRMERKRRKLEAAEKEEIKKIEHWNKKNSVEVIIDYQENDRKRFKGERIVQFNIGDKFFRVYIQNNMLHIVGSDLFYMTANQTNWIICKLRELK